MRRWREREGSQGLTQEGCKGSRRVRPSFRGDGGCNDVAEEGALCGRTSEREPTTLLESETTSRCGRQYDGCGTSDGGGRMQSCPGVRRSRNTVSEVLRGERSSERVEERRVARVSLSLSLPLRLLSSPLDKLETHTFRPGFAPLTIALSLALAPLVLVLVPGAPSASSPPPPEARRGPPRPR